MSLFLLSFVATERLICDKEEEWLPFLSEKAEKLWLFGKKLYLCGGIYFKTINMMETTLVLLKPSCVQRQLIGEIVNRFERRGLRISGMKMMQLSDEILREHYAHLVDKPFFPGLCASMQASPVVAMAISGVEAVQVVRTMAGVTNGRQAAPGTIRGDYSVSNQQNIVHASDSVENAAIEVARFFRPEEVFDYESGAFAYIYGAGECK